MFVGREDELATLRSVKNRTFLLVTKREPAGGMSCKLCNRDDIILVSASDLYHIQPI